MTPFEADSIPDITCNHGDRLRTCTMQSCIGRRTGIIRRARANQARANLAKRQTIPPAEKPASTSTFETARLDSGR